MPIELPQVPAPGHGRSRVDRGGDLVLWTALRVRRRFPRLVQQQIDLGERKAGDLDVKVDVDERLQLDREHLAVPAGVQRELVVGDNVGPALCRIEMG